LYLPLPTYTSKEFIKSKIKGSNDATESCLKQDLQETHSSFGMTAVLLFPPHPISFSLSSFSLSLSPKIRNGIGPIVPGLSFLSVFLG